MTNYYSHRGTAVPQGKLGRLFLFFMVLSGFSVNAVFGAQSVMHAENATIVSGSDFTTTGPSDIASAPCEVGAKPAQSPAVAHKAQSPVIAVVSESVSAQVAHSLSLSTALSASLSQTEFLSRFTGTSAHIAFVASSHIHPENYGSKERFQV